MSKLKFSKRVLGYVAIVLILLIVPNFIFAELPEQGKIRDYYNKLKNLGGDFLSYQKSITNDFERQICLSFSNVTHNFELQLANLDDLLAIYYYPSNAKIICFDLIMYLGEIYNYRVDCILDEINNHINFISELQVLIKNQAVIISANTLKNLLRDLKNYLETHKFVTVK